MNDIKSDVIKGTLVMTGVYPLDRSAITADLLVGDAPKLNSNPKHGTDAAPLLLRSESAMQLVVFDDDGCIVDSPEKYCHAGLHQSMVIGNRKSRATYLQNDVTLHPAVWAGIVDMELASAFMPGRPVQRSLILRGNVPLVNGLHMHQRSRACARKK